MYEEDIVDKKKDNNSDKMIKVITVLIFAMNIVSTIFVDKRYTVIAILKCVALFAVVIVNIVELVSKRKISRKIFNTVYIAAIITLVADVMTIE